MKAKLILKNPSDHCHKVTDRQGKIYDWELAYECEGIKYYTTESLVFFDTNPFPETDLQFIE